MAGYPYTYVTHCTRVRFGSIFERKSAEQAKKNRKKLTSYTVALVGVTRSKKANEYKERRIKGTMSMDDGIL